MTAVYDASVVVRWFVGDALSDAAHQARAAHGLVVAPAGLLMETANAFRRYVVARRMTVEDARGSLELLGDMALLVDPRPLVREAFELACAHNHSMQDCLYIVLALRRGLPLVTADGKLARKFADLDGLDLHALTPAA